MLRDCRVRLLVDLLLDLLVDGLLRGSLGGLRGSGSEAVASRANAVVDLVANEVAKLLAVVLTPGVEAALPGVRLERLGYRLKRRERLLRLLPLFAGRPDERLGGRLIVVSLVAVVEQLVLNGLAPVEVALDLVDLDPLAGGLEFVGGGSGL